MPDSWKGGNTNAVPFGLKDGKLWFVSDVDSGLACGCRCPDPTCDQPLVARNKPSPTRKRVYHFMHAAKTTSCGGRESALHRMAKEVLLGSTRLTLPAWGLDDLTIPMSELGLYPGAAQEVRILDGQLRPDVRVSGTHPDARFLELYVEVKVTHAIDWQKQAKICAGGLSVIEIDLSDATDEQVQDSEAFEQLVLHTPENRTWVNLGDPAYLAARLGCDIIEVTSTDTYRHDVKAKSGNTMHFDKQRALRYQPGQRPVPYDFEIADTYREKQRIDGIGNTLPYQPGLYVVAQGPRSTTYGGYDQNFFKTFLKPVSTSQTTRPADLFGEVG